MSPCADASEPIPMIHMSVVSTLVDLLDKLGAPLDRGLSRMKLPTGIVGKHDGFLPCLGFSLWTAFESRCHGIDNIGLQAVQDTGLHGLPSVASASITSSPTLYCGLRVLCAQSHRASSRVRVWLADGGEDLHVCHRGSFPRETPGQVEMA